MAEAPTETRLCWCGVVVFTYYDTGWFESGKWPPVRHGHDPALDPDELLTLGRDPEQGALFRPEFEGIPVPPRSGVSAGPVPWPSERGL